MRTNYCLPIIKTSASDVKKEIGENNLEYQYFEVWLDYIEDLDLAFVEELKRELGKKAIFLFRRQNLETIKISLQKRKEIMDILENSQSFLDIDIETQKEEAEYIKGRNIGLILSYHNYRETPSNKFLNEVIERMKEFHPSVYKVATFCKAKEDALTLLELLLKLKEGNLAAIILGMGEQGIITRIFGTLWGNEMVFAPKEESKRSAPGQLTKKELEKILLELH